jgi:hypothetical protein
MSERVVLEASLSASADANRHWLWQHVENALRDLQFGSITLIVQDGVVVQVERTERKRYQRPPHQRTH